jgi:hypothetical protein
MFPDVCRLEVHPEILHSETFMPSFARADMDADPAAISNYVIGHFGGRIGQVTPETAGPRRM